jgi:hypothetical protein
MTSTGTPVTHSLTHIHSNNQSINQSIRPDDLLNPKRPHDGKGAQTKPLGLTIPDTPTWRGILKDLRVLAARDNASCSYVYREALIEYHQRHFPGNPALPLTHWTIGEPLSIAAQEKLSKAKLPPAGSLYNLKCRFCGDWFDTDVDMPVPACPKCSKPEAAT